MSETAQVPFAESAGMLLAWVDALPANLHVALFTGVLSPDINTSYSQVLSAAPSGSWYAPIATTMLQNFRDDNGYIRAEVQEVQFNYGGSSSPVETITGAAVVCPSTTRLLFSRRLDAPVQLKDIYSSLNIRGLGIDLPDLNAS